MEMETEIGRLLLTYAEKVATLDNPKTDAQADRAVRKFLQSAEEAMDDIVKNKGHRIRRTFRVQVVKPGN